jgi:hypothetical protein
MRLNAVCRRGKMAQDTESRVMRDVWFGVMGMTSHGPMPDSNSGPWRVGIGDRQLYHPITSFDRHVDVNHALKKAPSAILTRRVITSPIKDPSLLMLTRSLASMLPCTAPRTTTSRAQISADTYPLRPTVTRQPGKFIVPMTLPSMYTDSEPITSPLTSKLLSIVTTLVATGDSEGGPASFCSQMVDKVVFIVVYPVV